MITEMTKPGKMTVDQGTQISSVIIATAANIDLSMISLNEEQADDILARQNMLQEELKEHTAYLIKKYAIHDLRFGPPIKEFDVTVPRTYHHASWADTYIRENRYLISHEEDATLLLVEKKYGESAYELMAGMTYHVGIHPIIKLEQQDAVTIKDCQNFMKRQNALPVGIQGLSLAQCQHPKQFPLNKKVHSFDQLDYNFLSNNDKYYLPDLSHYSMGETWNLGIFKMYHDRYFINGYLLCFYEK
jgi:hypothetical protein